MTTAFDIVKTLIENGITTGTHKRISGDTYRNVDMKLKRVIYQKLYHPLLFIL